ncbi:MAG: aminotransferase class I/II-fold pyridoxal phosphate-dependent enzyme [Candidatus Riflebacteria bacterium]|nr:aminotransferase class I/II-fold pyridoxal phosphate-dependent enzyme [Candidatus Riflebacteria bacterium]
MCALHFSQRVSEFRPSSIRKMSAISIQQKKLGKTVYELNIGQPDISGIPAFGKYLSELCSQNYYSYSPYIGEATLRENYAKYLNFYFDRTSSPHLTIDSDNVTITVGAVQALCNTFLALCNPGDEILCVEPFFPVYATSIAVSGGVLRTIPTYAEQNFALPEFEELERYINPKTRAILLNNPNNPSGKIFSKDEVMRLVKLSLKYDIFLISDEVYREMYLAGKQPFSVLQADLSREEMDRFIHRLIVIDSASKTFALTGTRLGIVVARPEIIEKISLVTFNTVGSVSDVMQKSLARTYEFATSNTKFFDEMRKVYAERLEVAMNEISNFSSVFVPKPEGAFYLILKFPELEDVTEFALFMLQEFSKNNETVAMTPAADFYLTPGRGKNEIRLALVVDCEKTRKSMGLIKEGYAAYMQKLKTQNHGKIEQKNQLGGKLKIDRFSQL